MAGMRSHGEQAESGQDSAAIAEGPVVVDETLKGLPPLANTIIDRAIDNMTRKLVAGYRNKRNAKPNAAKTDYAAETKETLEAVSAQSVMDVANRGQAWKEMIQKSLARGISSLATIDFDGEFAIENGQRPEDFKSKMPDRPGVYVVFNQEGNAVYVGDSDNMGRRWDAGHFNEYAQGQKSGDPYKLAPEFEAGCTVKYIGMDSKETAAALEAHLIKENFDKFPDISKNPKKLTAEQEQQREQALEDGMLKNKKEELKEEQGTRSNQEAKKMKDASGETASLVMGAAGEAFKNVGYDLVERLTTATIKAIKDELVDILRGGKAKIALRVRRLLQKILAVLEGIIQHPLQILRGIVEFIVNALSRTIGQIYNLARNIFDLANGAWQLYRGAITMSREELVRKISETIIISGSLVIWDALDAVLEKWIAVQSGGTLAPFAPYFSAAITAVGFGLSSYALQAIVTRIIDSVIAFKQGTMETLDAERAACDQLIQVAEKELRLMADLGEYLKSSLDVIEGMRNHTATLSTHTSIQALDFNTLRLRRQ